MRYIIKLKLLNLFSNLNEFKTFILLYIYVNNLISILCPYLIYSTIIILCNDLIVDYIDSEKLLFIILKTQIKLLPKLVLYTTYIQQQILQEKLTASDWCRCNSAILVLFLIR